MPFISMHARKIDMKLHTFTLLGEIVRAKYKHTNKPIDNLALFEAFQVGDVDFEPLDKSLFIIMRTQPGSERKYVHISRKELGDRLDLSKLPFEARTYYFMLDNRLYIKENDAYYKPY